MRSHSMPPFVSWLHESGPPQHALCYLDLHIQHVLVTFVYESVLVGYAELSTIEGSHSVWGERRRRLEKRGCLVIWQVSAGGSRRRVGS